jgi:hypothetical protein
MLADPAGVSIAECVDAAEEEGLDLSGNSSRRVLEMAVEKVIGSLFSARCVTPQPAGEIEQHAFALWDSGWFARHVDYECSEYRDFCGIKWTANSRSLPTIGFIDV